MSPFFGHRLTAQCRLPWLLGGTVGVEASLAIHSHANKCLFCASRLLASWMLASWLRWQGPVLKNEHLHVVLLQLHCGHGCLCSG